MSLTATINAKEARAIGPLPNDHPNVGKRGVGVLLVNLGTPDGTDFSSMRRYLKEFLSDRRVIEWPRILWYPILYGIVLNTRPKKSGHAYRTIWNRERDESPLRTYTRAQAVQLAKELQHCETITVDWAMRYGNPSMADVVNRLLADGCDRIVLFPLYPQYSATTSATVLDRFFEILMKRRFLPAIRTVPPYYDEPVYIEALARSIEQHLSTLDFVPERIIASYHGIPKSYFERGDPYHCHCMKTTRLLRERLGWDKDQLVTCFQSRFGPEEWLQPYTDKTVEEWARQGIRNIAVLNPGFVSDCLETLEEIAIAAGESFRKAGGENFSHIPCLNDSPNGMAVITELAKREIAGWAG